MRVARTKHDDLAARHSADGGGPRQRLLDAAERLFAARGYDAASVREITAAAGCNVAAINYHFGGKERLYVEVFRRRFAALREQRAAALQGVLLAAGADASVELVVRTFATSFLEPLLVESQGRLLLALFSREMLDPHLPRNVFVEEMLRPVQQSLREALHAVAPTLDDEAGRLAVHSLVAQLVHVVHSGRLAEREGFDPLQGIELDRIVDHIVRFSTAGIAALVAGEGQ